ncbi:hypothetical protein [Arthrobacter sp. A2-55]|uniref:hypothetical protein n=1 Tax=Arthrobacter sp. A2-55 TaxID=2897337 RepID=UPI0021CD36D1|nr:hypothetical protein [Arthrobacter sp. A2-55]MCU6479906.1 hypothetical protein [Arthrobacter sp. A2-55]
MNSNSEIRVLIYEPVGTGHRFYYVRLLIEAALKRGDTVAVGLTRESFNCPEYKLHLKHFESQISMYIATSNDLSSIESISEKFRADLTVIPDGDIFARRLIRKGKWRGAGRLSILIMRERSQNRSNPVRVWVDNSLKKSIFTMASRMNSVKIVILKSSTWKGVSNYSVARDPVSSFTTSESIRSIRESWQIEDSKHWFGIFGNVDMRKNLSLIAQSIALLHRSEIGILIAGQCQQEALDEAGEYLDNLRESGVKVVVVNRILTDLEMDSAIAAVDTAVLAHSNESPSGILGKAVVAGTDVVAAGAITLKEDAKMIPQNAIWCPLDMYDLKIALEKSMERSGTVSPLAGLGADQFTSELLSTN